MASKRFLCSIIFLCFLFTVIFLLVHRPQTSPKKTNVPRRYHISANGTYKSDRREEILLGFKPRPDSQRVVIEVDKITTALWDSGFRIMSLILDRNLRSLIPYADSTSDSGGEGGDGGSYNNKKNNTITLYNGSKITIFAPVDASLSFKSYHRTRYPYQIVPMKVDKEDFSECVFLPTFGQNLLITKADMTYRVNQARITHWNIYNDNNVVVHGVENNFSPEGIFDLFLFWSARRQVKEE